MKKEFVMRGQTGSGLTEVLNFSGYKPGYAYRLISFELYPSTNIGGQGYEHMGAITAGKTALTPLEPNFNDEGLIATSYIKEHSGDANPIGYISVVNDLFLITQNLILMVQDTQGNPINWQCRFVSEKMSGPEEAAANYRQYAISDE